MQASEFCETLNLEWRRNKIRCAQIEEARKALATERRALQNRARMLAEMDDKFRTLQQVVEAARYQQARLNPVRLYRSFQRVVEEADATAHRLRAGIADSTGQPMPGGAARV